MNGADRQSRLHVDLVIPVHTRYLSLVGSIGEELAREVESYDGDREALGYNLNLVLTEATTNVIEHCSDKTGAGIRISIRVYTDELCIRVHDTGKGFDIDEIPQPDLENPTGNGLGIFFIRTLMDSVSYDTAPTGNVLEMKKKLC